MINHNRHKDLDEKQKIGIDMLNRMKQTLVNNFTYNQSNVVRDEFYNLMPV
jgi:hypothetical protein